MASKARSTEFRPSVHGWAFSNFGDWGNCGGMCWSALDGFYSKRPIDRALTAPSEALKDKISRRQRDTLDDWVWAKVLDWTRRPDLDQTLADGVGHLTQKEEWPKIKDLIDHGEPATLCVIRQEGITANPAKNHQVIAWGYDYDLERKHVSIKVYDPNHENDNDDTLEIDLGRSRGDLRGKQLCGGQEIGVRMRGFFLVGYDKDINLHIHRMNVDATVGKRVDQRTWHSGWTQARPYVVEGVPHLFLLKREDGAVHLHRLNEDGTVGTRIKDYDWTSGWTSAEFFSAGGRTYLLLLKEEGYADDGKNVHIHLMNADGTVGERVPEGSYRWSEGWTRARPYTVNGVPYLFLLKKNDGAVHIHRLNDDGTVGDRIKDYNWGSGWTTVEFFSAGGRTYLLLLKEEGYGDDDKNVHIHVMNPDGRVGSRVPDGSYRWSKGWTQARPYVVGEVPYLFLLKKGDGAVHIHRLNDDGTVGDRIKDYNWSSGWTSVEFCSLPTGTYLLLLKDSQRDDSWLDIPFV